MWIIARVASLAAILVSGWLAFELSIFVIAKLGYVPSYEDTPGFYKIVGDAILIPTLFYVFFWYCDFTETLEQKRLEIDLQPTRIEPLLTETVDNGLPALRGDSPSRLIEDRRWDLFS